MGEKCPVEEPKMIQRNTWRLVVSSIAWSQKRLFSFAATHCDKVVNLDAEQVRRNQLSRHFVENTFRKH